jgi:hypothetical protein
MQQEDQEKLSRTDWAERDVEEFVSLPFISEFVFRSLKTFDRSEKEIIDFMLMHVEYLQRGAMAFYKKNNCMVIVDRDGEGYEIAKSRVGYRANIADRALGGRYFAHLRSTSITLNQI